MGIEKATANAEPSRRSKSLDADIFAITTVFPEPEAVFNFQLKPIDAIKDSCIFVVDTNSLLLPYTTSSKGLAAIEETFRKLIASDRLVVPAQVAREFAKNRAGKISELYDQLSKIRSQQWPKLLEQYPLFEAMPAFEEARRFAVDIRERITKYNAQLGEVLDSIKRWTWNDPVSECYKLLFAKGVVKDVALDPEARAMLSKELEFRIVHKIPPGYKDASKIDGGLGDLLIWKTILATGKEKKSSVIFVSGDEKSDWWYRTDNSALYPRYELVDEFRRHSDDASFHILPFWEFLKLFDVSSEIVEEVRTEEISHSRADDLEAYHSHTTSAVEDWFRELNGKTSRNFAPTILFDFVWEDTKAHAYGVNICINVGSKAAHKHYDALSSFLEEERKLVDADGWIIVFVEDTLRAARDLRTQLERTFPFLSSVIVGYMSSGLFIPCGTIGSPFF